MNKTTLINIESILNSKWFVPFCLLLHIAIRLILLLAIPIEQQSDAAWYLARATDIAAGRGYSEAGYPTAFWPVGYPGFLGLLFYIFGSHAIVGQLANLVLSGATLYLVLKIARLLTKSEITARISILLLALYPNNIAYVPILLTETYFTFILLLGIYLYITRYGPIWWLFVGLIFGLATLTKPQVIFLPGILLLLCVFHSNADNKWKKTLVSGFIIYFAMALILIPWAIRNTQVFGQLVLVSTNSGVTLLTGNNPSADGGYTENDTLVSQRNFTVENQIESDHRAKELAIQWIKENQSRFIQLIPLKLSKLWNMDGEAEWAYQAGYKDYADDKLIFKFIRIINQILYLIFLIGFIYSLPYMFLNKNLLLWPWPLFGIIFAIYLSAISTVFSGQSRFHFPIMPWFIIHCAWTITFLWKIKSHKSQLMTYYNSRQ